MKKIPLYFNFTGKYEDMLDSAIKSVRNIDIIEVKVFFENEAKPFTYCLNKILLENTVNKNDLWFFMHYDAEILDESIFIKLLDKYNSDKLNIASVSSCEILDLLVLYDTNKLNKLGGWDERFLNSYMELDLRNRIYANCFTQPILNYNVCPEEILHKDASSLRRKDDAKNNLYETYIKSLKNDINIFIEKYPNQSVDMDLYEKIMNETWA